MDVASKRCQQLEFELAVTGILEDVYDLDVCAAGDPMNRRSQGIATLEFEYGKLDGSSTKVEVRIQGQPETFPMTVNFSSPESIIESAQRCEDLAKAVQSLMDERGGSTGDFERRWDDLGF